MDITRKPPQRLGIIMAMQKLLEQISTAEGDAFDMAGKVYRGRLLFGPDVSDYPPALSVIEAPRPDIAVFAAEENSYRRDMWTLMIQGIVGDDKTVDTCDDAYYLAQDVERRLMRLTATKRSSGSPMYPETHMLDGKITSVEVAPPVIRPPEAQVSSFAFFYLPVRVGLAGEIGE